MLEHRPTEGRSGEGVISGRWSRAGLSKDCLVDFSSVNSTMPVSKGIFSTTTKGCSN